ncbi:TolC family protein [Deferribacteres bacterium DY0037]
MKKFLIAVIILLPAIVFARNYQIGVVASSSFQFAAESIELEIGRLVAGNNSADVNAYIYEPSVPVTKLAETIKEANSHSDILILIGEVAAGRTIGLKNLKPTVAVFSTKAPAGASFTYTITSDIDYNEEFTVFRKLFRYKNLKVLTSGYASCSSAMCKSGVDEIIGSVEVPYEIVSAEDLSGVDISTYFDKGDVALVMEQPQMTENEYKSLLERLANAGVRTFSFGGYRDAELGVIAVNARDKGYVKTARTAAVAVSEIIAGQKGGQLKVNRTKGLVINMAPAALTGFYPDRHYIRSEEIINYDKTIIFDKYIGYKEALLQAVKRNEDVATGRIDLETAREMVKMSESAFRPTLNLSAGFSQIDDDRARISQGTSPERTGSVSVALQQIIYSEEVFSLKDQAVYNAKAMESLSRQAELDVLQAAAKAYLQVLLAKTYVNIAQDNLETTKYNYDLAKNRDVAGAANPAEIPRWEARIALSKIDVVNALNTHKSAMTELARIISEDIDGTYNLEPVTLDSDYSILSSFKGSMNILDRADVFDRFKKTMTDAAVENSVELASLEYLTGAADRSVLTAERKFYLPTVTAGGEYKRFVMKDGEASDTAPGWYDDTEWNVGVTASIPIYEGGRRSAQLSIEKTAVRKLYHEKAKAVKLVRQRMITALENARAAYDSFSLANESAVAAAKTLKIVSDLYSRGAVSITELIDSQNAKLNADMNTASSQYSFMERIVDVERAYGCFFAFAPDDQCEKLVTILKNSSK